MLNKNIINDPKRLKINPAAIRINIKFKYGLSLLRRCISGLLFVRNIIAAKIAIKVNKPVMNCTGLIILFMKKSYFI